MSGALKAAVHWRHLEHNAARGAAMPKTTPVARTVWTAEQARAFLAFTVLTPHGLRRISLTLAVSADESPHAVMKRAGHASITMSADLYAYASRLADQRVSDSLERLPGT
jgi:integrase